MGLGTEYPTLSEAVSSIEKKAEIDADSVIKTITKSGGPKQVKKSKLLRRRVLKSVDIQSKASKSLKNSDKATSKIRAKIAEKLKRLASGD